MRHTKKDEKKNMNRIHISAKIKEITGFEKKILIYFYIDSS